MAPLPPMIVPMRGRLRRGPAVLLLAALGHGTGGCTGGAFACSDDQGCAGAGTGGVCEPTGFCSFPDDDCGSGRRYGAHAGEGLAGACVEVEAATSSSSGTTGATLVSLDGTISGSTAASSTGPAESSSTTGADTTATTGTTTCPDGWWDCAWSHRLALTLAPLTFTLDEPVPVLVRLTPERWDPSVAQPAGQDLRFIDATGGVVPHEIEATGDAFAVWIRWPAADLGVHAYWGNPDASDGQDLAGVWQDDHEAVWHLDDGQDAVGAHPLTAHGTASAPGIVAVASAFDGSTSYMQGAGGDSMASLLAGPATLEAWILPTSFGDFGRGRVIDNASDIEPMHGWSLQLRDGMPNDGLMLEVARQIAEDVWFANDVIVLGQWQYVAAVFDGQQTRLYVDGAEVQVSMVAGTGPPSPDATEPITLGRIAGEPTGWFDGTIDEVRLSSVARDPAWIAMQWSAVQDGVLVYGPVEQAP